MIHNGVVYLSGQTASADKAGIEEQTRDALAKIDKSLAQAGTDKSRLLTAQIWLRDIDRDFEGMNTVWSAWLDKNGIPTRATGESHLARPDLLVEIIVTAAL
ncbi:Enamine deaminase RidA (YjgF/YER057c/UK114 family) OS=Castellaniella defragrans OX=75697 GN=HNR28_001231 PE=4 SV=1 [Castellaniella defragrans]